VSFHGELLAELTLAENFYPLRCTIGQAKTAQSRLINPGAILETIQGAYIHWLIADFKINIVEPALRHTTDQWHLTTLESDADGTSRPGGLTFASASAGFTVPTGFALAQPFATVFASGTRL
jgi:hypothetical protein